MRVVCPLHPVGHGDTSKSERGWRNVDVIDERICFARRVHITPPATDNEGDADCLFPRSGLHELAVRAVYVTMVSKKDNKCIVEQVELAIVPGPSPGASQVLVSVVSIERVDELDEVFEGSIFATSEFVKFLVL